MLLKPELSPYLTSGVDVDRMEVWLRCWWPSGPHPELGQVRGRSLLLRYPGVVVGREGSGGGPGQGSARQNSVWSGGRSDTSPVEEGRRKTQSHLGFGRLGFY